MIKRVRPAKHYQRDEDPARKLMLANKPKIRRDLRGALQHIGDHLVNGPRAVQLLRAGRYKEMGDAVNWNHYREILKKPFARIADAYTDGATLGVRKINGAFSQARRRVRFRKQGFVIYATDFTDVARERDNLTNIDNIRNIEKAVGDIFNFDLYTPDVQAALRQAQDDLIQQLEQSARDAIETIVMDGAMAGLSAEDIVADIRDLIGLTDTQAQAVLNFRDMLETLDPGALTRQLRNTTYDAAIQDAIDQGQMMASDVIDQMVQDYTDNYLDYRASTIAQTESVRAVNEGLHDAYSQAIDRGALPDSAVTRQWQLGDSPCPICESIPDNNPDGVAVDEPFDSDDGPVDDPPVHPNCMCSVDYVTDISQVPDDSEESGAYDTNVPIEGIG